VARIPAKRILIVRLGAIGDVVNSSALLGPLREVYPDAFIAWAVHPPASPMIAGLPGVDEVIVIPRDRFPWRLSELADTLRRYRFDLAIDLQKLAKSALVAWLSGAPVRLGYDFGRAKELSWMFSNRKLPRGDPQSHVVDQVLEFAAALGATAAPARFSIPIHDADRALARRVGLPAARPHIVLSIGASEVAKRWFAPGFARLIDSLAARGAAALLIGGPSDDERRLADEIRSLARAPFLDAAGQGGVRDLLGLLEHAGAFVGSDTGPLHLAAAMGIPTVGLYGPQNPSRSGPYGWVRYTVFKGLPCSPCFAGVCPHGTTSCMRSIRSEDVLASIDRLVADRALPVFATPLPRPAP
jgi:heptosyltransferase-1